MYSTFSLTHLLQWDSAHYKCSINIIMINITCQDRYAFITVLNGCSSKGVGLKKVLLFSPWLFSCVFFPQLRPGGCDTQQPAGFVAGLLWGHDAGLQGQRYSVPQVMCLSSCLLQCLSSLCWLTALTWVRIAICVSCNLTNHLAVVKRWMLAFS